MIAYVDTSSLLELLIDETGSEQAGRLWDTADALASDALVVVEARAALAAAERGARASAHFPSEVPAPPGLVEGAQGYASNTRAPWACLCAENA